MMLMEKIELTAGPDASGRLDAWLAGQCVELSRSALQNLMEQGRVTRGGSCVNKKDKVVPGAAYCIDLPEPQPIEAQPQNIPLDVVYEDNDLIVINKPKGMVVHPAPGNPDGTLVNALLYHCAGQLSGIGGAIRPGIVHRIDKDTSGLLVIACQLKTGRTHQIRVHMASIGHPLAGDAVYGPRNCIKSLNGQCLHAKELGFIHPATQQWVQFDSPLPAYFTEFLTRLRKEHRA